MFTQVHNQLVVLFTDDITPKTELSSFISGIVEELIAVNEDSNTEDTITKSFAPILDIVVKQAAQSNLFTFHAQWFTLLQTFSAIEPLAKLIIRHSTPETNHGRAYSNTLLGTLLGISCLPKTQEAPYDLFDKPLQQVSTFSSYFRVIFYIMRNSTHYKNIVEEQCH